jgi:branched-chain amino acid transport system ATP-binding protein
MTALLEANGVSQRFGGVHALRDVTVNVDEGSILGVIGPNGAGKTTLINVVTGFLRPTSGTVSIAGSEVTGAKPWEIAGKRVARTFQIVKPFREMTVRENVAVGRMFGPSRAPSLAACLSDADDVLERVALDPKRDAPARELSVAEAKRLELARALAMNPRLLLLDEVMAGLRPQEIEQAVMLIRSLRDEGITIVAVEHVVKAIMAVSDEILVLHEGRVLTRARPEQVASDERVIEAYLGQRYAERMRKGDDSGQGGSRKGIPGA